MQPFNYIQNIINQVIITIFLRWYNFSPYHIKSQLIVWSQYRFPFTRTRNKSLNLHFIHSLTSRNIYLKLSLLNHNLCFFYFWVVALHPHMSLVKSNTYAYEIFWSSRFYFSQLLTLHIFGITNRDTFHN